MSSTALAVALLACASAVAAGEFYVAPTGSDANPGTKDKPFATVARARDAVRQLGPRRGAATVVLRGGTHTLPETLVLGPEDSGTKDAPVTYAAAPGEQPVLSGGSRLELTWKPYKGPILQAAVPKGTTTDQLFVNGERQHMARTPNFDPGERILGGHARDCFSKERASRWSDPKGAFIHAMHRHMWGDFHYVITGKDEKGNVTYEGGWQNNRRYGMHGNYRFVENVFEELDAPGEWFLDRKTSTLYLYPPEGTDLANAVVETVRLRHLVELRGTADRPVRFVAFKGITFRHAARTFMDNREPLLRSDWTTYRGGAIVFEGAEDCVLEDCVVDQVGGNAVFASGYNRRLAVRGCHIVKSGGNGVAFVGSPKAVRNPLLEYSERQNLADIDREPGPKSPDYPADCLVEDCLIHETGRVEKQTSPVQIAMARRITVRHCSLYDVPRAGINIGDGCWGGHVVECCDVFDTVKETGDHGSFNSWGRDRYWGLKGVDLNQISKDEKLKGLPLLDAVEPVVLRNNRWRCDHGWDIDLDDGSSHYELRNNLCLAGGIKLREGFYRVCENNIMVGNSFHPHVWYRGSGDVFRHNIVFRPYRPIRVRKPWGKECDGNLLHTPDQREPSTASVLQKQSGLDAKSLAADAQFVDPAKGDYRVREGSPALTLGFQNFPMDQFGVRKPELKAIARTPALPSGKAQEPDKAARRARAKIAHFWQQARVRDMQGEEYSAFGAGKEDGGVVLADVPAGSPLAGAGLQTNDLVQSLNGKPVRRVRDLLRATDAAADGKPLTIAFLRSQKTRTASLDAYTFAVAESAASGAFRAIPLAEPQATVRIASVGTRPSTVNEPVATLHDGKLASDYGPVFPNGVWNGRYRVDLGKPMEIRAVNTFTFNQNDSRGVQHFVLFASNSPTDPGWNTSDRKRFTPLVEVDTTGAKVGPFHATQVRASKGGVLGTFRWLVWAVLPVTERGENSAFQELQVLTQD